MSTLSKVGNGLYSIRALITEVVDLIFTSSLIVNHGEEMVERRLICTDHQKGLLRHRLRKHSAVGVKHHSLLVA